MNGGQEKEVRYGHLFIPNKDLAANWAVDVARELECYLAELAGAAQLEDGNAQLNFAEAALVIQGSTQIYSKKVEYLYSLVYGALEFILQKKQAQQEKNSTEADGKETNAAEEEPDEEFLKADDIKEDTNIDIDDEADEASAIFTAKKPPNCLLVLEGDGAGITGDGGELAVYQISTSTLHRDFLLLDPCDGDAVDNYLNANIAAPDYPLVDTPPRTPKTPRTPKSGIGTPGKRPTSAQKSSAMRRPEFDDPVSEIPGDSPIVDECPLPSLPDFDVNLPNNNNNDACQERRNINDDRGHDGAEDDSDEENEDPWQLLNPHEPGDLPVKPYRQGILRRKRKTKNANDNSFEHKFPLARKPGVLSQEFSKAYEAVENADRDNENTQPSLYEKLRSSLTVNEIFEDGATVDDGDQNQGFETDFEDNVFNNDPLQFDDNYPMPDNPAVFGETSGVNANLNSEPAPNENNNDDDESFESLCKAHMESLLRNIAESAKQTELAARVSTWKHRIEKNLKVQDSHPPFDIHVYGEKVLDRLSSSNEEADIGTQMPFTAIVAGDERHEVARTFAALLQLVNNGNVALLKGDTGSQTFCFTAEKPFAVKLLSSNRRHEEMLHKGPSMGMCSKKASKKNKHNLSPRQEQGNVKTGNSKRDRTSAILTSDKDVEKKRLGSASRIETDNGSNYSFEISKIETRSLASKVTPDSKRRRRFHSVRPVEIQVAR